MKTIRLFLFSIILVALTVLFANATPGNAATSDVQAVGQPQTHKTIATTTTVAAPAPVPQVAAVVPQKAKPPDPTPTPVPVPIPEPVVTLTDHEQLMQSAGISQADWSAVDYIVSHESGWCATKWEGTHDCPVTPVQVYSWDYTYKGYGMCQSTPAIKMSISGADWQTNPVTQLEWCSIHAAQYGGWQGAYQHWLIHHNW